MTDLLKHTLDDFLNHAELSLFAVAIDKENKVMVYKHGSLHDITAALVTVFANEPQTRNNMLSAINISLKDQNNLNTQKNG
jgi:hypothetical protein